MTAEERSHRHYMSRKENGLCPRCGKKLDREGHYCKDCLKKNNEYRRKNREFSRKHGLCPTCGKEKLFGTEKQCPECRAKRHMRKKPTHEQQHSYNEKHKARQKILYQERSELGICTRCGKRKAMEGRKKCGICLEKDRNAHRAKYVEKEDIREIREREGLCYRCGKELDRDGKMCKTCQEECTGYLNKARAANPYWRNDDRIVFRRRNENCKNAQSSEVQKNG